MGLFSKIKEKKASDKQGVLDIPSQADTEEKTKNKPKTKSVKKNNQHADKLVYHKTCAYCGKLFQTNRPDRKYCKRGCSTMASRKGLAKYNYLNQLERGFKRHMLDYMERLIRYSGGFIESRIYFQLSHEWTVINGLVSGLVDPKNEYYRVLRKEIHQIFPREDGITFSKDGTHVYFMIDDQTYRILCKYVPDDES